MMKMQWIRLNGETGEIAEVSPEDATHVPVEVHRERGAQLAALLAEIDRLTDLNKRLHEKHQQNLRAKARWRDQALRAAGGKGHLLRPTHEIVVRDRKYWSVRLVEVTAETEQEALKAALAQVADLDDGRLVRVRFVGLAEWQAEIHVRVRPESLEEIANT